MRFSLLFVESRRNNEEKTHLNMYCRYVPGLKINKKNSFPRRIYNEYSYICNSPNSYSKLEINKKHETSFQSAFNVNIQSKMIVIFIHSDRIKSHFASIK